MSNNQEDVDRLNRFLRGELSAVETYQQCMQKLSSAEVVQQLRALQLSHQARARLLVEQIGKLGGRPASESGVWGTVAGMFEAGARVLGEDVAVSALVQGENHGLNDYHKEVSRLSPELRSFLEQHIVPEQRRTHAILTRIDGALRSHRVRGQSPLNTA